ncbi:MAG: hypothetical protein R3E67_08640 [Pseudomonadales bacterium]
MRQIADNRFYIANDSDLAAATDVACAVVLGIDTEFIRIDTFYPIPALLQLSDGKQCWLIDVLHINNFAPLLEF